MNGGPVADNLMQEASDWGPWQSVIEDGLAACTVRVRLLGQGLGETSRLTRSEFRAEAAYLYELADELVERCDDVERWLSIRTREGQRSDGG